MNYLVKISVIIALSLSSLAAADAASETISRRFNCVFEKSGSMQCHEGHEIPCVCFFDVSAPKATPLKTAIVDKLKAMGVIDPSISGVILSLYGIGGEGSIHKGWDNVTIGQEEAFWATLASQGYTDKAKDLGNVSMALGKLADYVIKLSY